MVTMLKPITPGILSVLVKGGDIHLLADLAPELEAQLAPAGIDTLLRKAHFLAQAAYESGYFSRLDENLNYSAAHIVELYGKTHPDVARRANVLAHDPKAFGSAIYANRFGNGNEASGDGYRFRGRGILMTTFRDNYRAQGVEDDPDSVATPAGAVKTAIAYWNSRKCNEAADADNCPRVTFLINGGSNGLSDRSILKARAMELLADGQST